MDSSFFRCHERITQEKDRFDGELAVKKEKNRPEWCASGKKKNLEIQKE